MIPKLLHYIWLGRGKKPEVFQKCYDSWKKYLPDYEIIEWNEDNFPIQEHPFVEYMYNHQLYAFASDYMRMYILYKYGGIYLDTDVELLEPFQVLIQSYTFIYLQDDIYLLCRKAGDIKLKQIIEAISNAFSCDYTVFNATRYPVISQPDILPKETVFSLTSQSCSGYLIHHAVYSWGKPRKFYYVVDNRLHECSYRIYDKKLNLNLIPMDTRQNTSVKSVLLESLLSNPVHLWVIPKASHARAIARYYNIPQLLPAQLIGDTVYIELNED